MGIRLHDYIFYKNNQDTMVHRSLHIFISVWPDEFVGDFYGRCLYFFYDMAQLKIIKDNNIDSLHQKI